MLSRRVLFLIGLISSILLYLLWPDALQTREYAFKTPTGAHVFNLKVAMNGAQHAKGLMFIKSMLESEGMIFVNAEPKVSRFWMRNTYIPLDIIFIDELHNITHIHENAIPLDDGIISHTRAAKYIVELNAGVCKKLGIAIGQKLSLTN